MTNEREHKSHTLGDLQEVRCGLNGLHEINQINGGQVNGELKSVIAKMQILADLPLEDFDIIMEQQRRLNGQY